MYSCLLCCGLIDHRCVGLFLGCSVPLICVCFGALFCVCLIIVIKPYCFDYYSFAGQPEVRMPDSSSFVHFSQDCFDNLQSFVVLYEFLNYLFQSCGKCHFDRDCIKSVHCFGYYGHFNNINSSNPQTLNIFLFICIFFDLRCYLLYQGCTLTKSGLTPVFSTFHGLFSHY